MKSQIKLNSFQDLGNYFERHDYSKDNYEDNNILDWRKIREAKEQILGTKEWIEKNIGNLQTTFLFIFDINESEQELQNIKEVLNYQGYDIELENYHIKKQYDTCLRRYTDIYSAYFNISKKESTTLLFKIRLSCHDLNSGNYLPAGVINKNLETYLTPSLVIDYVEKYNLMSRGEQDNLFRNRYID